MHDQQALASKPLLLNPRSPGAVPPKSPAALQGAVFAFLPKPATPSVSRSSTSVGARIAASTAGTQALQRSVAKSPERRNGSTESSPTRGRQLPYEPDQTPRATEYTAPPSTSQLSSRPSLKVRSSSTLAAQHASAQSRSPRRSPNRSVYSGATSIHKVKDDEKSKQNMDALSGATASMAAGTVWKLAPVEPARSVRSMVLNFEGIPQLSAVQKSQSSVDDEFLLMAPPAGGRIGASRPRSLSPNPVVTRHDHTYTTPSVPLALGGSVSKSADSAVPKTYATGGPSRYEHASNLYPNSKPVSRRGSGHSHSQLHQETYGDSMTVNDLADAMVASTLASSRAASPSKKQFPRPPPRQRAHSTPTVHEASLAKSRETRRKPEKPPRAMKHTLRKQASSDDETSELTKRGRKHWMRKHPNKYSEGDRKRWRDKITARERRRYEGIFAANRGLLIGLGYFEPSPDTLSDNLSEGNQVVNIIVRDIWERCRLPRDVLKEIYDLVSPEEAHALNREQFVVGLWLIDQRLKGRKLPVKVSASVWSSVRHSEGIKIRSRRYS